MIWALIGVFILLSLIWLLIGSIGEKVNAHLYGIFLRVDQIQKYIEETMPDPKSDSYHEPPEQKIEKAE
jgi:hypothetical protein